MHTEFDAGTRRLDAGARGAATEADEPARSESSADTHGFGVADLLSASVERRRWALRCARSRRWIDSYGEVLVRVILIDARSGGARNEFVRALARNGRDHSIVLEHTPGLVLVTSERRIDTPVDEWLRSLTPPGVRIAAVGSATVHPEDDDLLRPLEEAGIAAELIDRLGGVVASTRAEDLGGWRLIQAMGEDPALIAAASPAADALWRSDAVRRQTVEAYLDSGCNAVIACRELHIHRTTLYYRLDGMPEVVREALADGLKRSTLHLSLKLLRLWDAAPATARSTGAARPPAPRAGALARVYSLPEPAPSARRATERGERSVG